MKTPTVSGTGTGTYPITLLGFAVATVGILSSEMMTQTFAFAPQPSHARSVISSSSSPSLPSLQASAAAAIFPGPSVGRMSSSVTSTRRQSQPQQAPAPAPAAPQNMELIDRLRHDSNVIFSILDADGSGSISKKEFCNHLQQAGCSDTFVDTLFDKMDFNGDGALSPIEFRTLYLTVPSLRTLPGMGQQEVDEQEKDQKKNDENYETIMAAADQVFQSLDSDASGSIDLVELKAFLSHRGTDGAPVFQDKAMENIFDLLDMNHDHSISKPQFRAAFWRYSALRQALGGSNSKQ